MHIVAIEQIDEGEGSRRIHFVADAHVDAVVAEHAGKSCKVIEKTAGRAVHRSS